MKVDNVLLVAGVALAVYALWLASRPTGAPAGRFYSAGPVGASDLSYRGVPLGYDSAGGPAYG